MSSSSTKYNYKQSEQNTINNDIPMNIEVSHLNYEADNMTNSLSGSIIHDASSTTHATSKDNQFQQYYDEFLSTNDKSASNNSHTLFDNNNSMFFSDTNHHKRTNNTELDDLTSSSQQTNDPKRTKSSNSAVWQKYDNVLLEDILKEDYEPENKRTNAILLNIKVIDNIKNKGVSTYSFKTQKNPANTDISYDHIFLFGSLCTYLNRYIKAKVWEKMVTYLYWRCRKHLRHPTFHAYHKFHIMNLTKLLQPISI
jgi:hypothetical protein